MTIIYDGLTLGRSVGRLVGWFGWFDNQSLVLNEKKIFDSFWNTVIIIIIIVILEWKIFHSFSKETIIFFILFVFVKGKKIDGFFFVLKNPESYDYRVMMVNVFFSSGFSFRIHWWYIIFFPVLNDQNEIFLHIQTHTVVCLFVDEFCNSRKLFFVLNSKNFKEFFFSLATDNDERIKLAIQKEKVTKIDHFSNKQK